ncbi:MAG: DEAD/DEAH box helicase family protein, partial [Euryarchaeota archaeon]|nr:DEAD/DEAH box helicase family protein [Euryarchaeota archaeon]
MQKIDHLIITSPYEEPKEHWWYDENKKSFDLAEGRRPAGYIIASQAYESADDPGKFIELPLVNRIRPRVKAWREGKNGGIPYAGATSITRRLLQHWHDQSERDLRFFFCQLDAMETLIWLAEAPAADKVGIDIPSDGGPFRRYCSKMATGSGKTIVMAMLIAWQALNKAANPQDARFSKNIFVVAPGLTVRDRLKVLIPSEPGNYYDKFNVVPPGLQDLLRQAKVVVRNRHILNWETDEKIAKKKGVDKRGARSDQAYVRDVLRDLANAKNILVINDEAHHAWRIPAESKIRGLKKEDIEEATKWVGGLDRIHVVRGILACYDFTATPFAPSGKTASEEALFPWIVSDFGLSDAIESGLVKTPRVVIRDDGMPDTRTYRSKLYHIYKWVKEDLNRKAQPHETLPDLIINGYYLLGKDWLETAERWKEDGFPTPPVMITVANRTETAARIKYALDRNKIDIKELCDPGRIIHIDSRILEKAESQEEAMQFKLKESSEGDEGKELSKKDSAEYLREIVNTIGVENKPGEAFQNVISVGMLTEGWDVKTVTHIMGLRAFSSQLLCEQVVGRGLRRTDYDIDEETGLLTPDYVNIFGVPFTFMPHETTDDRKTRAQVPKYVIEPRPEKQQYELQWPRIARIEYEMKPTLSLDMRKVRPLELVLRETITRADMAK